MLLDDWAVGLSHVIDCVLAECQDLLGIPVVQVIKEDSTEAAHLLPVCDGEVLVTPLLELGVELRIVAVADSLYTAKAALGEFMVASWDTTAARDPSQIPL